MADGKKKYYDELNIFRSLIIIWVVIGHSFDTGSDFLGLLHTYAYTFHMKAFILLSGLLFAKKIKALVSYKDGAKLIGDRFLRLMVPYFFYTAVSIVLKLFLDDYANNKLSLKVVIDSLVGVSNPNGGIWFLYALFVLNVFAVLIYKLPALLGLILTFALHIVHIKTGVFSSIPLVTHITFYGVFFYGGMVIADYYDSISLSMNEFFKKSPVISGAASLLYLPVAFIISLISVKALKSSSVLTLLIPVLNITVYYCLSVFINSIAKLKKPFVTVGDYGMDIYLIGYYVQITLRVLLKSMLGLPYVVYSLAMCICGLLVPIPISKYFVRKFRITRILALGDYKKRTPKEEEQDVKKA